MLIKFHSKAAADVLMYEQHAEPILRMLNKDLHRGIITADQTAGAIAMLEQEIARSASMPQHDDVHVHDHRINADDEDDPKPRQQVSFAARAYPLLDMLRAANKMHTDVVWGV